MGDDFPLDPNLVSDYDNDGIDDADDPDDDNDNWCDAVEIAGGFDPRDNSSIPSDEDGDGTADFMDPDFLTVTEYNNQTVNQTVWNNQTVNQTVNQTIYSNSTIDGSEDTDGDGWTDAEEILAGTDPEDATDEPADADGDGIADFMDPDEAETVTTTETPTWAWGAVIAAIVLGILAGLLFMRQGKTALPLKEEKTESENDMEDADDGESEEDLKERQ